MLTEAGILSTYLSISFLMTPSAPITTGTVSVHIFHIILFLLFIIITLTDNATQRKHFQFS